MRVRFLYPVPYPAPYAAWIQIFRTAAALRCGGDDVAVITGRSQAGHAAPDPADAAVPHARDGAAWAAAMAAALRTDDPASRSAGLGWAAGYAWPARAERLRAFLQRVGAETPG